MAKLSSFAAKVVGKGRKSAKTWIRKTHKKSPKMSNNPTWNVTHDYYLPTVKTSYTYNTTTNLTQTRTTSNLHVATVQLRTHHTNNPSKDSVIALIVGVTTATLFLGIISAVRKFIRPNVKTNTTSPGSVNNTVPSDINPTNSDTSRSSTASRKHSVAQQQKKRTRRTDGILNEVILLHIPIEKQSSNVSSQPSGSISSCLGANRGCHSRTNSSSSNISYFESIAYHNMELEEP